MFSGSKRVSKILVVGQTPPPFGGQAIMIGKMLKGSYGEEIRLVHVRMAFSRELDESGKFKVRKLFKLCWLILRILIARFVHGADILYYPPAGTNRIPVLRDLAILIPTRRLFRKTIFHFHAAGLGDFYHSSSAGLRFLCRLAYFYPDAAICLSEYTHEDGKAVRAKREFVVPNGIEDESGAYLSGERKLSSLDQPICMLNVGLLSESKGVITLLEACCLLAKRGIFFQARFMGAFESPQFELRVRQVVQACDLEDRISFLGVLTGAKKWEQFARADIFCFPTHHETETFGIVLLEAMSFGLPVIATRWRGIPSVVQDGVCGFLVPVKDPIALAARLEQLIRDPELRRTMGQEGQRRYLENFTNEKFHDRMKTVFRSVAELPA
ncbi:MAG: glycosyltransferase family 4 protein [Acidobacteria bacterium]|nr:glycosyltransferase family 4 protein [Acidobacteriota bacterium]